jgi:hypothetical protein
MKEKIKEIAKESGSVISETAIMEFASHIPDPKARMALIASFNMSKSMYGLTMETRQDRLLDWVEMVKNNTFILTEGIIKDPQFQDGFVHSLEQYLKQRHEEKREIIKNIFLGYSESENKKEFELERMYDCVERIPLESLENLKKLKIVNSVTRYQGGVQQRIKKK